MHVHAEGFGYACDGGPCFAQADDADGLACKLGDGVVEVSEDGGLRPGLNLSTVAMDGG